MMVVLLLVVVCVIHILDNIRDRFVTSMGRCNGIEMEMEPIIRTNTPVGVKSKTQ